MILFLAISRKQLFAALAGSGRNSGFVFAPFIDGDFTVRAWQICALLSPGFWASKKQGCFFWFPVSVCRWLAGISSPVGQNYLWSCIYSKSLPQSIQSSLLQNFPKKQFHRLVKWRVVKYQSTTINIP